MGIFRRKSEVDQLCEQGSDRYENGDYEGALRAWSQAESAASDPDQQAWISSSLGDALFMGRQYPQAAERLAQAERLGMVGNPYIALRYGQTLYELGQLDRALDRLTRAYMGGGEELFADEDPKYLRLLHERLDPPPAGWPASRT